MDEFIGLTSEHTGKPLWVRASDVDAVHTDKAGRHYIDLRSGKTWWVRETPEAVLEALGFPEEPAGKQRRFMGTTNR